MGFLTKFVGVCALLFALNSNAQKPASKTNNTNTPQPVTKLNSVNDSIQYTLGSFIAQWINSNGFEITNATLFIKGMDDVFLNKPRLLPDSIIAPLVTVYQQALQKDNAVKQEKQLFVALKDKPGVGIFPNGIGYRILKAGKGPRPTENDSIIINLIAKLANETVVEDTYRDKKPFAATPASFFKGLKSTLQEMPQGSIWTIYVPSVLAYGEKGTALIPPNSALVLEVELVEVRVTK